LSFRDKVSEKLRHNNRINLEWESTALYHQPRYNKKI